MKGLLFKPEKASLLHNWDPAKGEPQTRRVLKAQPVLCDTTQTWRFATNCTCDTYKGNLGACLTWLDDGESRCSYCAHRHDCHTQILCPFKVGETRYVKEPFRPVEIEDAEYIEFQDGFRLLVPRNLDAHPEADLNAEWTVMHDRGAHWRNPLFLPEFFTRTLFEITRVRCERVSAISEADAIAEGIKRDSSAFMHGGWWDYAGPKLANGEPANIVLDPRISFKGLWESIHGKKAPWQSTWVWPLDLRITLRRTIAAQPVGAGRALPETEESDPSAQSLVPSAEEPPC